LAPLNVYQDFAGEKDASASWPSYTRSWKEILTKHAIDALNTMIELARRDSSHLQPHPHPNYRLLSTFNHPCEMSLDVVIACLVNRAIYTCGPVPTAIYQFLISPDRYLRKVNRRLKTLTLQGITELITSGTWVESAPYDAILLLEITHIIPTIAQKKDGIEPPADSRFYLVKTCREVITIPIWYKTVSSSLVRTVYRGMLTKESDEEKLAVVVVLLSFNFELPQR